MTTQTRESIVSFYLSCDCSITDTALFLNVSYSRAYRAISKSPEVPQTTIEERRGKAITAKRTNSPSPRRKLSSEQVEQIRDLVSKGEKQKNIASLYQVERSVISNIARGLTYRNAL